MTTMELALYRYRQLRIAGHEDQDLREAIFLWDKGPESYLCYAGIAYPQRAHLYLANGSIN